MRKTGYAHWSLAWISISQRVVDMLDVAAICQAVCDGCVKDLGFRMAWIGLVESQQPGVLRPIAQSGFPEAPDMDEEGYRDSIEMRYDDTFLERGATGIAIQDGQSVLQSNIDATPSHQPQCEAALGRRYRSSVAFPLQGHSGMIGALNLYAAEPDAFGEEDVLLLSLLATHTGMALENARRFQAEQRQWHMAESLRQVAAILNTTLDLDTVLTRIMEQLKRVIRYDSAGILLQDGDDLVMSGGVGFPDPDIIIGQRIPLSSDDPAARVFKNRHTLIIANVQADSDWVQTSGAEHIRGWMGVPLLANEKSIGALIVGSTEIGTYGDEDAQVVLAFANQATIAIENARLYAEIHQRADELAILNRIGQAITSTLDLQQTLTIITDHAVRLLGVAAVSVALRDEANGDLWFAAASGEGSDFVLGKQMAVVQGIVGWCVQHGKPVLVPDVSKDSRFFGDFDRGSGFSTRSILCVPLQTKGQTIGAIEVMNKESGPFDREDLRLLTSLAAPAATAIENARLYKDLQDQMQARAEAQAQLMQSEKLAATGRLVAGVAHELNNPLTAILGFAQLLQHGDIGEEARSDLDKIVTEARRAAHIVHSLLDFARQRTPERKPVQVNDVVTSTLNLLAYELRTHNIECITHLSPDLPLTMADPHQLQQVWVNLVHNARQAMSAAHGGGHLTITTQLRASISIGSPEGTPPHKSGDEPVIRIMVKDDGPGITSNLLPQIFDPFFTTKPEGEGIGLGLSVCHGIVSEHGGHIWAESEPGRGTTFFIELPVVVPEALCRDSAPGRTEKSVPAQSILSDTARILMIDDQVNVLALVVRALQREGYRVDAVSDGETALARLAEASYDLILCDVRMPGLSGPEIYRQVQGQDPDLAQRIIFTIGDTISRDTQRFLEETGVPYLSKPFELADLIKIVRKVTSGR